MLHWMTHNIAIPYNNARKVPMPKMRQQTLMVRIRRRRPDSTVFVWSNEVSYSGDGGRDYRAALRSASSRCDSACRRNKNLSVSDRSKGLASEKYNDRRHSQSNWIKGQRNGISRRDAYGSRIARTSCCKEGSAGREHLETHSDRTTSTGNKPQRSK